jgi:hypothetical protein
MDEPISPEARAAAEATARRLAEVFIELRDGISPSRVIGADLSGAACFRRAVRLMVFLCDTDSLTLWSSFSLWWMIDGNGFRQVTDWGLIRPFIGAAELSIESPYIKFACCCGRVRFGIRLGPKSHISLEGERAADGSPVIGTLGDLPPPAPNWWINGWQRECPKQADPGAASGPAT